MAISDDQKKRNRKILRYALLLIFTIGQSLYLAYKDRKDEEEVE